MNSQRFYFIIFLLFAVPVSAQLGLHKEAELVYIFATGPDLYDPAGRSRHEKWETEAESSYAKSVVDELVERVKMDHPYAATYHLKAFTLSNLREVYRVANARMADRVILSIVAHGGIENDVFYIWTDSGKLFEDELLDVIKDTPTDVAFYTCKSGAVRTEAFPGGVFGASLRHTAMDAVHFYGWASFLRANPQLAFPESAKQLHQSWLDYRIHEKFRRKRRGFANMTHLELNLAAAYQTRCWAGSHPFFYEMPERLVEVAASRNVGR